ncbi:MAG: hypothetical protein WC647_04235 [Desulfomonilaceae bacterium]
MDHVRIYDFSLAHLEDALCTTFNLGRNDCHSICFGSSVDRIDDGKNCTHKTSMPSIEAIPEDACIERTTDENAFFNS